jgi:predicted translin family RNA/ssDNA-binding protein
MIPIKELHNLQQEYTKLLRLHPHAEIYAGIYEVIGTPIDEMELEIEKINKLIDKLKTELDTFDIKY